MKYLALTELDNENKAIATIIYDNNVFGRIFEALTAHYDADIENLKADDLEECFGGRVRRVKFSIDGIDYAVQIEQTWLY